MTWVQTCALPILTSFNKLLARNFNVSNLTPSGHRNPDYTVLLILVCIISCKFSHLSHLFVFSFTLISYISYTLDLPVTPEDVCWSIRNVKFDTIKVSYTMRVLFLMFVTTARLSWSWYPFTPQVSCDQKSGLFQTSFSIFNRLSWDVEICIPNNLSFGFLILMVFGGKMTSFSKN